MNRQQISTLLEILSGLEIGDNTVEQPLQTAMNNYYDTLLKNREGKTISAIEQDFTKKVDLLRWKLSSAFRVLHSKEMAKMNNRNHSIKPQNEKEYIMKTAAKMLKMTPQNLGKHLDKHPEIKVNSVSPRKNYLSETELNKLKKILGITA
jgi:hypothetical protein